ncbi:helix-turn-helix transcriptional regulator [Micromonospora sp. WMMC241]|uniref:helix-turn-helix transcriptional regulator n=1 Tax=Micromonospora sp. WMMC241 TaxID=3015159 RepID=UPI0022B6A5D8|nr:helix-turn-helix transcriptional regulator [Micromonospora sp. WMMC241]MCZ7434790.1 helix-turn-helix transcriptional regulator [Micromonospora sp. WMMC241]MCZ7440845.1 helix-turn-helix transcriptional regulator [Micromonospora sp. WMMC241]MCZ7440900.1 helix-turn-helix transcriptional regulator [Micromonospora sp. WMMC241]
MILFDDLHPDDHTARINLRNMLVERRVDLGYSQAALAQHIGASQGWVANIETGTNWHIAVLQRLARGINARIVLYPDGVPGGPYDNPAAGLFRPTDPTDADRWDQQNLLADLATAREATGLTRRQVGERLGCSGSAVGNYERTRTGLVLISPQRYCRAIGGRLAVELEHLDAAVAVPA